MSKFNFQVVRSDVNVNKIILHSLVESSSAVLKMQSIVSLIVYQKNSSNPEIKKNEYDFFLGHLLTLN